MQRVPPSRAAAIVYMLEHFLNHDPSELSARAAGDAASSDAAARLPIGVTGARPLGAKRSGRVLRQIEHDDRDEALRVR